MYKLFLTTSKLQGKIFSKPSFLKGALSRKIIIIKSEKVYRKKITTTHHRTPKELPSSRHTVYRGHCGQGKEKKVMYASFSPLPFLAGSILIDVIKLKRASGGFLLKKVWGFFRLFGLSRRRRWDRMRLLAARYGLGCSCCGCGWCAPGPRRRRDWRHAGKGRGSGSEIRMP